MNSLDYEEGVKSKSLGGEEFHEKRNELFEDVRDLWDYQLLSHLEGKHM